MSLLNPNKLVGLTIEAVGTLEKDELDNLGWEGTPVLLRLSNGTWLLASADEEMNSPGEFILFTKETDKLVCWLPEDNPRPV